MKRPILVVVAFLALGCGQKKAPASAAGSGPSTASAPPAASSAAAPAAPGPLAVRGVVQETFDASDYTYMRLKTADGETWAAVTKAAVKKGDEVTIVDAAPMDGFESKTLNRKFDRIVFGALAAPGSGAAAAPVAPGHAPAVDPGVRQQMAAQHAMAASGPADVGKIDVKKAEGTNGRTVAELFSQRAVLKGQEVAVRGKVVKFTSGVMGRNWVHLRDGSGSREKKDDDVTITTNDVVAVGDVVLVRGTVGLDKDFGAGYVYPVLIEGAKVAR